MVRLADVKLFKLISLVSEIKVRSSSIYIYIYI
jgi:hypothetical protein